MCRFTDEEGIPSLSKSRARSGSDVERPSNPQPAIEFEDSSAASPSVPIPEKEGGVDEERVSTLNKPAGHSELFATKDWNQPTLLPSDEDEGGWSTVTRKRKGHGSTACIAINVVSLKSAEVTHTLSEAERTSSLTGEEHLHIQRREHAENKAQLSESESLLEEGLLQSKGKGTDPRKWGQLDLQVSSAEIDASAQRMALEQWKQVKDNHDHKKFEHLPSDDAPSNDSNKSAKKKRCRAHRKHVTPRVQINDETDHKGIANPIESLIDSALKAKKSGQRSSVTRVIELAHQIVPASYLGRALKQIGKCSKRRTPDSDSSSETESDTDSDDSVSSEPSDSSSSSSETSTSGDDSSEREYCSK